MNFFPNTFNISQKWIAIYWLSSSITRFSILQTWSSFFCVYHYQTTQKSLNFKLKLKYSAKVYTTWKYASAFNSSVCTPHQRKNILNVGRLWRVPYISKILSIASLINFFFKMYERKKNRLKGFNRSRVDFVEWNVSECVFNLCIERKGQS